MAANMRRRLLLTTCLALPALGCREERADSEAPQPRQVSDAAVGEFCGMSLTEHPGPKGQIFLRMRSNPLWFASVRDTIAFTMLPEMPKDIAVVYVNDMALAHDWEQPETWVAARQALFVIGSRQRSYTATDEAVPFSDAGAARRFAAANGGRVVRLADIPATYIFSDDEPS